MVRNGRYRCDQIDAVGGVHTTAADELRFSTCFLVCSRGTRHRRILQSLKPFGKSTATIGSKTPGVHQNGIDFSSFTHILSARATDKARTASHGQDRLAGSGRQRRRRPCPCSVQPPDLVGVCTMRDRDSPGWFPRPSHQHNQLRVLLLLSPQHPSVFRPVCALYSIALFVSRSGANCWWPHNMSTQRRARVRGGGVLWKDRRN